MEYETDFNNMNLSMELLRGITKYGFNHASIIQSKTIPHFMSGRDIIAQSQSGTGKTGSFVIGMLSQIDSNIKGVHGIILANTKELAMQIHSVCTEIGHFIKVNIILCIGGQSYAETRDELSNDLPSIIIGTPARIYDLDERNIIKLNTIRTLVLDEADVLLSGNFLDTTKNIISLMDSDAQICIFSATMDSEMLDITNRYIVTNPITILLEVEKVSLDGIKQFSISIGHQKYKFNTLRDIYNKFSISQTIIYVNSIHRGEILAKELIKHNFDAKLIHGKMSMQSRNAILKDFRKSAFRILISTDLLARGIDIQQISIVINYDIPKNVSEYMHRIGRSGRYGRKGVAINMVSDDEKRSMENIANYYKINMSKLTNDISQYL